MHLEIDLSPAEVAQLTSAAQETGLTPEAFVKKLLHAYLPSAPETREEALDRLLERWQTQDGTILRPEVDAPALFGQWAQEDRQMSAEEKAAEERLWEDLEASLTRHPRKLTLKRLTG